MTLQQLINQINTLAPAFHSSDSEDYETSGDDFQARLLIAQYILSKVGNVKIGNHEAGRLLEIFEDQATGQNDEAYCGEEEAMLQNLIEMFTNPEHEDNTLIDDYPVPGKYVPATNVDEEIYMIINYYLSKFWPQHSTFQYQLEDFGIEVA